MHQHAVSCQSYKKECCSFLLIQPRKSAAIFSRAFAVHGPGSDVNTLSDLYWRGEEKKKGDKGGYNRGCAA